MAKPDYRKTLAKIGTGRQSRVFEDFVRLMACSLSAGQREAQYMQVIKNYTKAEHLLFAEAFAEAIEEMERRPFTDILGTFYMEGGHRGDQQHRGEFYTPRELCLLNARTTLSQKDDGTTKRPFTVLEPSCGSGNMILAMAEILGDLRTNMRVTAVDIVASACDMAYINTTLWGVPAVIYHGNTLTNEMWARYPNVHWIQAGSDLTAIFDLLSQQRSA